LRRREGGLVRDAEGGTMLRTLLSIVGLSLCVSGHAAAQGPRTQGTSTKTDTRAARPATLVNLNTATATQLQELPGIGAKTAERIIEYRQKKGPFKKIEELMNVKGIGEKSFLKLRPQITVTGKPEPADQQ
jgi:comEA protein